MTLSLGIAGAGGRMGQALVEAIVGDSSVKLGAALDAPGSACLGQDAGARIGHATGIVVGSDVDAAVQACDVLIDFTRPAGTLVHAAACARHGRALVAGTTGFSPQERVQLAAFAATLPIMLAPNMSVGINVLVKLVELAAARLGPAFDIEVVEMHHSRKVDAPSGTALRLGEAAAVGAGIDLATQAVYSREGITGERKARTIGFATLRGGDVVGEHSVIFAGVGERLELTHRATSRQTFAVGALRAARFIAGKPAGLYDMADVLDL